MPLKVGLIHTQLKISRAKRHLDELKIETTRFLDNPYTITPRDDSDAALHILHVQVNAMKPEIGSLIGDFSYQLRSSLDNLAWQLALLTTDSPNRDTSFPILESKPSPKSDRFIAAIWDIPCAAVDIIKSLQPYTSGKTFKDHPLWQLNKLCNLDKHRSVAVVGTDADFRIDFPGISAIPAVRRRNIPSENAFEIAFPLSAKEKMQFNVTKPKIIFGEPIESIDGISDFELTINQLDAIYDFVRNSLYPKFVAFFV